MRRKLLTITTLMMLIPFLFTGCDLLQDDEDPGSTEVLIPSGMWIESTEKPTMIVDIDQTNSTFTIYLYDSTSMKMHTYKHPYTLTADKSAFQLDQIESAAATDVAFSYQNSTVTITYKNVTISFIPYAEKTIPHAMWEIKSDTIDLDSLDIDTGKVDINGIPSGAWQIAESPMDEILFIGDDSIVIFEYGNDTMRVQAMPYTVDTTNKIFKVTAGGIIMPVSFNYASDTLRIITSEGSTTQDTIAFVAYEADSIPPASWNVTTIIYDDEGPDENPDPKISFSIGSFTTEPLGAWQTTLTPMDEIIVMMGDTFYMYSYENDTIFYSVLPYTVQNNAFMIEMMTDSGLANMPIPFSYIGDTLTVLPPNDDGTGVSEEKFVIYNDTTFPASWKTDHIVYDDFDDNGGNGDYLFFEGQWFDTNDSSLALVLFRDSSGEFFNFYRMMYNATDSSVSHEQMYFRYDETNMRLMFDSAGTKYATVSESGDGMITLAFNDGTSHTLKEYMSSDYDGYPDWWNVVDYHGVYELFNGDWISPDSNMIIGLYVWEDSDGTIKEEVHLFTYLPGDSMVKIENGSYSFDETSGMISFSNSFTATYDESTDILTVVSTEYGTVSFISYDMNDGYPKSWIVKDGGHGDYESFMGGWLESGTDPDTILHIHQNYLEIQIKGMDGGFPVHKGYDLEYDTAMNMLYLKDFDGMQMTAAYSMSSNDSVLTITFEGGSAQTFDRNDGISPDSVWDINLMWGLGGNWILDGSGKNTAYGIYNDNVMIYTYNPVDSSLNEMSCKGEISSDGSTLTLADSSGTIIATIPFEYKYGEDGKDTLAMNGTAPYNGGLIRTHEMFPLDTWEGIDWDDNYDDYKQPPFLGEWTSSDGSRITAVGPTMITHIVLDASNNVTVTRLEYWMDDMSDTLRTKDLLTGTEGWALLYSEGDLMEIEDISGLDAVMNRYDGPVPPSTWSPAGGDDLSFTTGTHIGVWSDSLNTADTVTQIVEFRSTLLIVHEYRQKDGETMIDKMVMDYFVNGSSLEIDDGREAMSMPFTNDGSTFTVTMEDDQGNPVQEMFKIYTGNIPHDDWNVTIQ